MGKVFEDKVFSYKMDGKNIPVKDISEVPKNRELNKGYYIHDMLQQNLDFEVNRVKKKWDCLMLMTGNEGTGKSNLAFTCAHYMSQHMGTKFDVDDIVFSVEQFNEWVDSQPPGSVCVWDEFALAGMSTEAMSRIQNTLIKKMVVMRKKQLIVFLLVPYIWLLRKYFAIARTRCLIHVYSPNNLDRGVFKYYSFPAKKSLYIKGEKYWDYHSWNPDFFGKFTDTMGMFFDVNAYEAKKDAALESIGGTRKEELQSMYKTRLYSLVMFLKQNDPKTFTNDYLGKVLGIKGDSVRKFYESERKKQLEKQDNQVPNAYYEKKDIFVMPNKENTIIGKEKREKPLETPSFEGWRERTFLLNGVKDDISW